jgi:hypothetical protein
MVQPFFSNVVLIWKLKKLKLLLTFYYNGHVTY